MILCLMVHLPSRVATRGALLQGIPTEARVVAGNAVDTFEAFSSKEDATLRRLRSFRTEVAKVGGSRYPMPEWSLSEDAYLLDPGLRLRFQITAIDATRDKGSIRVFVRFQRFVDKKDVAGSFGTPGKVLTTTESLQDTYVLRQQAAAWRLAGYDRAAMKDATEVKP